MNKLSKRHRWLKHRWKYFVGIGSPENYQHQNLLWGKNSRPNPDKFQMQQQRKSEQEILKLFSNKSKDRTSRFLRSAAWYWIAGGFKANTSITNLEVHTSILSLEVGLGVPKIISINLRDFFFNNQPSRVFFLFVYFFLSAISITVL